MAWTICLSDADISSVTTAYTVATGFEARLTASFTNRSTSATATVSLWVVPSGEVRGNEHLKESGTTLGLAGTSQAVLERSFIAPAGCVVYVQASTANVSCQVQGDVVTPDTFGVTDGTSSIVWNANWADYLTSTSLKKDQNGQVSLYLRGVASGAGGIHIATLPTGYRPGKSIVGVVCVATVGLLDWPYQVTILTSGEVYVIAISGISTTILSSGNVASLTVSFFI